MLKKIEALEKTLNKILLAIIAGWLKLMHLILPEKFFVAKNKSFEYLKLKREQLISFLIEKAIILKDKAIVLFFKIKEFIQKFSLVEYQNKITAKLEASKTYWKETSFKEMYQQLKAYIKTLVKKLDKFEAFSPTQIVITGISLFLLLGGSLGVYFSGKNIFNKEFATRAPASVQEYNLQPAYEQYPRKTLKVLNMKIPISVENVADVSSITIDFSVRTSTRFARFFLENYEYKLKDYFFTTTEPVVSDFPLEEEGKEVLKEKIIFEINNFLRENRVEGEVEEVQITFIVAS